MGCILCGHVQNKQPNRKLEADPFLVLTFKARFSKIWSFLVAQMVKNLPAVMETRVGKIPWRREWLPTPVFLTREFHGQKSLEGYSSWTRLSN